jgi:NADPH:quinone reductase-like Zn-dependent oxidoreductase
VRQAWAEYVCAKVDKIGPKSPALSFEEAACLPIAGRTALEAIRDHGRCRDGARVIVVGASGGVGHFAVQIAKHWDTHVTAVCSTPHVDMVRGLGVERVIDYKHERWTDTDERVRELERLGARSCIPMRRAGASAPSSSRRRSACGHS